MSLPSISICKNINIYIYVCLLFLCLFLYIQRSWDLLPANFGLVPLRNLCERTPVSKRDHPIVVGGSHQEHLSTGLPTSGT